MQIENRMNQGKGTTVSVFQATVQLGISTYILLDPPPYESDGCEKHSKLLEHECVKMEEEAPPPPYSMRHWTSRRCGKPCGLSLKNVLLLIIMCLVAALLATYLSGGNFLAGNSAQLLQVAATSQPSVSPMTALGVANETTAPSDKVETHDAQVVTTQAPTKAPTAVVTTQAPTKAPTAVVTTQAPTEPPTQAVTTYAQPPTQAVTTYAQPPTTTAQWQWDWRSRGFTLSCQSPILTDTVLSANCQTISGKQSAERSQLDLNCVITNVDGVLQWAYKGTVANYKDSSKDYYIIAEGGGDVTLRGKCQTTQGRYIDCSIVLNTGIENIDGKLTPRDTYSRECTYVPEVPKVNTYKYASNPSDDSDSDECILRIFDICLF